MIKIGSARIDENGNITGGTAGDQTGKEAAIEPFYFHTKTWLAFVPKDKNIGKKLAKAMKDACNNNKIGYDQGNRLGVYNLVKDGTNISDISVPTEADCSGLVRACILAATGKSLGNFNTTSEPGVLEKSGLFEEPFEVKSTDKLALGTVLVTKVKGHTAIVVEVDETTTSNSTNTFADEVIVGKKEAKNQVAKFKDDKIAGTYKVTCELNLRRGAGVLYGILSVMPKNSEVKCYGFYNKDGMNKWYYVSYNGIDGYCNAKYLRKV